MNCYENLKNNLKFLRAQNNETQQKMAEKTGIPRANLARYETGENIPPLEVILLLSKYFDISIEDLLEKKL